MDDTASPSGRETIHSVCDILDMLRRTADRHDRVTIATCSMPSVTGPAALSGAALLG